MTVSISGENCEQILNLCAKHSIRYRRLHYKNGEIIGDITINDFRKLRTIRPKNLAKIHIVKKRGLPFKTEKYKKRFGFIVGFAIFIIIIEFLSGYIWNVSIIGNSQVKDAELIQLCENYGIKIGTKISEIDTLKSAQQLLIDHKKLAWASLNIEGTLLTVNVTETKNSNEDISPSNLVAKADGEIKKIDVTSGTVNVKIGDTVRKGDILVSGIIENLSSTAFVNSKGTITAFSVREISVTENYRQKVFISTNHFKTRTILEVFTFKIPLYLGDNKNTSIDTYKSQKIKLLGEELPIIKHIKSSQLTKDVNKVYKKDELLKIADSKLDKKMNEINFKIIDKDEKIIKYSDDGITVSQRVIVEENIAENHPILINTIN